MKLRHKNVITKIKRDNARALQTKNDRVKAAEELALGLQELFNEMVDEVSQASKSSNKSKKEVKEAKAKAAKAHADYVEHKLLSDMLKDEVRDAHHSELSLKAKVEEYGDVIDYLSREMEEQEREFDDILAFIDAHASFGEDACNTLALSPNYIAKHNVPNKRGKGTVISSAIIDYTQYI